MRLRPSARVATGLPCVVVVYTMAACGGGSTPSSPSESPPPAPTTVNLTGETTDGMTNAPLAGVTVSIEGVGQ